MIERRNALEGTDAVVVLDIPLLRPVHRDVLTLALVVVVDCPVEVARDRLVSQRHFSEEDVAARMAAQPTRAERLDGADLVIDNSADRAHLEAEVERVWTELQRRRGEQE
jgi:dephospho-CoA kinase